LMSGPFRGQSSQLAMIRDGKRIAATPASLYAKKGLIVTKGAKGLRRFCVRKTGHDLVIYFGRTPALRPFYWVELAYHPRVTSARIFSPTFLSP
jgi:hypothetical protein